jgi:hypothetical protein
MRPSFEQGRSTPAMLHLQVSPQKTLAKDVSMPKRAWSTTRGSVNLYVMYDGPPSCARILETQEKLPWYCFSLIFEFSILGYFKIRGHSAD